jgi:L-cysteate sulfo-lyase
MRGFRIGNHSAPIAVTIRNWEGCQVTRNKYVNPTGEHDRLHFSHLPTPLEPMDRLSRYLGGPHLFIKRDDCTGLATGGNSTRKLEFLMADAIGMGADVIITRGPIQSNHARQTAAIAGKLSMQCTLALEDGPEGEDRFYSGSANILLDRLYGADIHRFPGGADMESATRELAAGYKALGKRPYVIPAGGSNAVGALGYVNCAFEIADQLRKQGLRIDRIVHATGSGGTQAGLIVGFALTDMKIPVFGISMGMPREAQEETVYDLVRRTCVHLGLHQAPPRTDVIVHSGHVDDVHGAPTASTLNAVTTVARYESILLDPLYTGKAMDALISLIVDKRHFTRDENILFLHTGGNIGLFGCTTPIDRFLTHESFGESRNADGGSSP